HKAARNSNQQFLHRNSLLQCLQNVALLQQNADGIGGLSAVGDPGFRLLAVDLHDDRVLRRIVVTDLLNKAAVTGEAGIRNHDTIERSFLGAHAAQSDFNSHAVTSYTMIKTYIVSALRPRLSAEHSPHTALEALRVLLELLHHLRHLLKLTQQPVDVLHTRSGARGDAPLALRIDHGGLFALGLGHAL